MDEERKDIDQVWQYFIQQGNKQSFETVFRFCYERMYGYGIKLCNQPCLVEDCIHDIFENIWERRDELFHIHSPNVYLFVSLRRRIRRRKKKSSKQSTIDEMDESGFIQFSRQELLIRDEIKIKNKDELQRAINQLTDRQKEIIILRFYNGMSYGEIEQILNINRQSVKNHIYRGMETLRSLFDNKIMKLLITLLVGILNKV